MKAEKELLLRRAATEPTPRDVYSLTLLTTEDVQRAERAEADFILSQLKANRKVEVDW